MVVDDKIPIGRYKCMKNSSGEEFNYIEVKFKPLRLFHKDGDIITLDMIEPYESEAVRKVAEYLRGFADEENIASSDYYINQAKVIVALVHEAEDADE